MILKPKVDDYVKTEKIAFLKIRNQAEVYFSYNGIDIMACSSNSG